MPENFLPGFYILLKNGFYTHGFCDPMTID